MEKQIKWLGMVPVRVKGVTGHIQRNQIITVDESIADNLLKDDSWELAREETTTPATPTPPNAPWESDRSERSDRSDRSDGSDRADPAGQAQDRKKKRTKEKED